MCSSFSTEFWLQWSQILRSSGVLGIVNLPVSIFKLWFPILNLEARKLRPRNTAQTTDLRPRKPRPRKPRPRKHRPRKHRPRNLKRVLKTYTFDENSLRMALIFPIVYGYWCADFAFFSVVWRLSIAIAGLSNKNRQQSNAGFLCSSRIYDCVMECLSLLFFFYLFP